MHSLILLGQFQPNLAQINLGLIEFNFLNTLPQGEIIAK